MAKRKKKARIAQTKVPTRRAQKKGPPTVAMLDFLTNFVYVNQVIKYHPFIKVR